jgi:hypothetical protein
MPRTLAARLGAVGFERPRIDTITLINDRYEPDTYSFGVMPLIAAYAKKQGLIPREEANAWIADLQALGQRNEYFFSLTRYLFFARRPTADKA